MWAETPDPSSRPASKESRTMTSTTTCAGPGSLVGQPGKRPSPHTTRWSISGDDATSQRIVAIERSARMRIRALGLFGDPVVAGDRHLGLRASGVSITTIYEQKLVEDIPTLTSLEKQLKAGIEGHVLPKLPMCFVVVDDVIAALNCRRQTVPDPCRARTNARCARRVFRPVTRSDATPRPLAQCPTTLHAAQKNTTPMTMEFVSLARLGTRRRCDRTTHGPRPPGPLRGASPA